MTLTTERLREIAEDGFLEHGDAKLMARELLANREAQPVGYIDPDSLKEYRGQRAGGTWSAVQRTTSGLNMTTPIYTSPPAPANAQPAGYFVRQRPEWDKRAPWTPWKEVDAASYDDIVKIIATGEAYCGWFYDTRILYDAPPAPAVPEAGR